MTRTYKAYKLHFLSPLHLSTQREDYSISQRFIPSDTMYAALTACLAKYGQTIPKNGDLGCTICSLFPFYQGQYFFPKPLVNQQLQDIEPTKLKTIKKVSWLCQQAFEDMLQGKTVLTTAEYITQSEYLCDKANLVPADMIQSQVSERVVIADRTGKEDAVPFYMDRVYFHDDAGLYFLAEGDTALLDEAMGYLSLEGIGTDRNVGNGYFTFEVEELTLNIPDEADFCLSLSSFIPQSKEQLERLMASDKIGYELQRRGGWITTYPNNTLRKNVIHLFAAGSVFANAVTLDGNIVDLRPQLDEVRHPIWRNGKALFIPIKL